MSVSVQMNEWFNSLQRFANTFISDFAEAATEPFFFVVMPNKRIYWLFLISSTLLAWFVLWLNKSDIREGIKYLFSRKLWLHPSSLIDFQWFILNNIIRIFLIVPLLAGQLTLALWVNRQLISIFGEGNFLFWPDIGVSIVFTVVLFLIEDFSRFFIHYLYHKVPFLWRFHAVHHSAEILTPITLYRIHFVEQFINTCRSLFVIGGLSGVFIYLFESSISMIDVLGVGLFGFFFSLAGSNLRHSSVWLSFGRLERWFISPAQHQIHHSSHIQHIDKNFGAWLAIWDRIFNSLTVSKGHKEKVRYGVTGKDVEQKMTKQILGI